MLDQDDNKVCHKNNLQEARPKSMSELSSLTSHDLALWNSQILINKVQYVKNKIFQVWYFDARNKSFKKLERIPARHKWDIEEILEFKTCGFSLDIFQEWVDSSENFPTLEKLDQIMINLQNFTTNH